MASSASLDTAIRLATQAVHQDSKKNFHEAARCYREAVVVFRQVARSGRVGHKVRRAIEDKCVLYENRLRKLDRHLLEKADFSKLFRDCVQHELRNKKEVDSQAAHSDASSERSEDSELLYQNPFLKRGLLVLEKAKREDTRCHLREALHFYEQGAGYLLDAVRQKRVAPDQADCIRIKCLLIHDRCELIRNHLEHGAPLKLRKSCLDSFESSLSSGSGSPDPMFADEERTLEVMDDKDELVIMSPTTSGLDENPSPIRVDASHEVVVSDGEDHEQRQLLEPLHQNQSQSVHSLYPTCVEVKRSPSVISGHSDFNQCHSSPIPLADFGSEMNLSMHSIVSSGAVSYTSPRVNEDNKHDQSAMRRWASVSGGEDGQLMMASADYAKLQKSMSLQSFGEQRDRNLSEITYYAKGDLIIDPTAVYKRNNSSTSSTGGSDSGFSDPASESTNLLNNGSNNNNRSRKSPLSDVDSLDIVPSLPHQRDSPTASIKSRSSTKSRPRRSGSSVKADEKVTVLSEETVQVSHDKKSRAASPEVYHKARPELKGQRREYIPPRGLSRINEENEEDDINKGCYYFMACLDSFWIL